MPVYPVEEHDGWIWVGPDPKPPPSAYDPDRERPPAPGTRRPAPSAPVAPAASGPTEHPAEMVRVAPGATFSLRLVTTPRPGFTWRVEIDGPLLAVVEERFVPPEAGEPAGHLVRVTARSEGESTLRCLYARPWDTEPVEVRTYEVRIEP
jgi:predicted secreted protein